jgi:FeS assembly SUF system protein
MDKDTTTAAASLPGTGTQPGQAPSPPQTESPASAPTQETGDLQGRVTEVLKTCFDPEIPVNIYELGLIYSIQVDPPGVVSVRMTLTSPACPVAGSLPPEVEAKIRGLAGVTDAKVDVVWEPPWSPAMMSDAAKLQLNLF